MRSELTRQQALSAALIVCRRIRKYIEAAYREKDISRAVRWFDIANHYTKKMEEIVISNL